MGTLVKPNNLTSRFVFTALEIIISNIKGLILVDYTE